MGEKERKRERERERERESEDSDASLKQDLGAQKQQGKYENHTSIRIYLSNR